MFMVVHLIVHPAQGAWGGEVEWGGVSRSIKKPSYVCEVSGLSRDV